MNELRPLLPFAAFALGIAIEPSAPPAAARAVLSALALLAGVIAAGRGSIPSRRRGAIVGAGLGVSLYLAGGIAAADVRAVRREPMEALGAALGLSSPAGRIVTIAGSFADDPRSVAGRTSARIEATRFETGGRVTRVRAGVLASWPAMGDEEGPIHLAGRPVEATLRLRAPRAFGNPGSPDAAGALFDAGLVAFGFAKSARLVEVGGGNPAVPVRRWIARRYEALFARLYPDPRSAPGSLSPEGAVLRASVLGGRIALPPEAERALVASGIYHILAVSGLQVAVFGGGVLLILRRTPLAPRIALLAAAAAVLLYAEVVSPSASVRRASLTAAIAASAAILRRRAAPVEILGVSACILLALDPFDLGEPGFQLTFAATAAILVLAGRLARVLPARWGLSSLLAASLAAQAATAPIVAVWFHRLVPFGLVSNLLAVPLGSAAVVLGIALLPADLVSHRLADLLGRAAGAVVCALLAVARIDVEGTILSFRVAEPPPATLALVAAGLVLVAASRRSAPVRVGVALAGLGGLWIACAGWCPGSPASRVPYGDHDPLTRVDAEGEGILAIDLIDVGQGDSILVQFPDGETMLVDGGGFAGSSFDVGERVVLPELLRRGLRRIGRVVLTHAHEDHGGGLREVMRSLDVDELLSPDSPQGPLRDELEALARAQGARCLRVRRGYTIVEGRTRVECLAPRPGEEAGVNAGSLVLRIVHGERSVLLTGDIGGTTEQGLLARGIAPTDILKAAHHGSGDATRGRFLDALGARVALISAGAGNRFDHPSPDVLARLAARRVTLLRTDLDGAVRVATDGRTLRAGSLGPGHPMPYPGPELRARIALAARDDDLQGEGDEREEEDRGAGEREGDP